MGAAMLLLLAGGVTLVLEQGLAGHAQLLGLLAVLAATAAWGVDNTLSRGVAERDPGQVVLVKSSLGACATATLAWFLAEPLPGVVSAGALLVIGAIGYGVSLRFYLLAQRAFGAGRTGSVFAFAPFIGALAAFAFGSRSVTWMLAAGGALMLSGVVLHLLELHSHAHDHEALEHEHAHSHDDGHHAHAHPNDALGAIPQGPHSQWHRHEPMRHNHSHVPDSHHLHRHPH
jgi:drug/metabolite transporter (DMT)-like permease